MRPSPADHGPGTIRLWHSNTYRLENTLNYGFERAWCLAFRRGSNDIAVGFDEGAILLRVRGGSGMAGALSFGSCCCEFRCCCQGSAKYHRCMFFMACDFDALMSASCFWMYFHGTHGC